MNILVFNCGSSSLTYKLFHVTTAKDITIELSGKAHRVGVTGNESSFIEHKFKGIKEQLQLPIPDHVRAVNLIINKIKDLALRIDTIGHRWGHGAGLFQTAFIDETILKQLELLLPFLPIHHPAMLSTIKECLAIFPNMPQYVTVDGAFHSTIPDYAYTYALPRPIAQKHGFRKYGFHGLSYKYIVRETSRFLNTSVEKLKLVACHLGTGGSSVAAVKYGKSIDTSMGYTGLPGLVMSTRAGDVDPMLALYLMSQHGFSPGDISDILNKKSGLLGVSQYSSDLRDIINILDQDPRAELAYKMYIHRVKKYIGSYVLALCGIDVLVFTDAIGVENWFVRESVCENMNWCGLVLDKEKNHTAVGAGTVQISSPDSKVEILVIPTEEEFVVCLEGINLIGERDDITL